MTVHDAADRNKPAGGTTRSILGVSAGLLLVNALALFDLARRLGALQTSLKWQAAIIGSLLGGAALLGIWIWSRGPGAQIVGRTGARVRVHRCVAAMGRGTGLCPPAAGAAA